MPRTRRHKPSNYPPQPPLHLPISLENHWLPAINPSAAETTDQTFQSPPHITEQMRAFIRAAAAAEVEYSALASDAESDIDEDEMDIFPLLFLPMPMQMPMPPYLPTNITVIEELPEVDPVTGRPHELRPVRPQLPFVNPATRMPFQHPTAAAAGMEVREIDVVTGLPLPHHHQPPSFIDPATDLPPLPVIAMQLPFHFPMPGARDINVPLILPEAYENMEGYFQENGIDEDEIEMGMMGEDDEEEDCEWDDYDDEDDDGEGSGNEDEEEGERDLEREAAVEAISYMGGEYLLNMWADWAPLMLMRLLAARLALA